MIPRQPAYGYQGRQIVLIPRQPAYGYQGRQLVFDSLATSLWIAREANCCLFPLQPAYGYQGRQIVSDQLKQANGYAMLATCFEFLLQKTYRDWQSEYILQICIRILNTFQMRMLVPRIRVRTELSVRIRLEDTFVTVETG